MTQSSSVRFFILILQAKTGSAVDLCKVVLVKMLIRKLLPILVGFDVLSKYGVITPNPMKKYLFRFTSFFGYVILSIIVILMCGYFVFDAKSFYDYSDNIYGFYAIVMSTIYFMLMPRHCKNMFELNMHYEHLIYEREFSFIAKTIELK